MCAPIEEHFNLCFLRTVLFVTVGDGAFGRILRYIHFVYYSTYISLRSRIS